MELIVLKIAWAFYLMGMLFYFAHPFKPGWALCEWGRKTVLLAFLTQLISLILRTVTGWGHPGNQVYAPWSNWFESLSFFAFAIAGCFLLIQSLRPLPLLGYFITPLPAAALGMALLLPIAKTVPTLPDALQSIWMLLHVPVMFFSYAALVNAFGVGLAFLVQERELKSKRPDRLAFQLPPLEELDHLIYRIISFAFPLLTLGIILGAFWAHVAWGRCWGWDPKETWSFITWTVYLVYLHTRLATGWKGRKSAYLSIAGFAVVLFTYVGVNYLSPLHGFLSGGGR